MKPYLLKLFLAFSMLWSGSVAAQVASTVPRAFDQLTQEAAVIVHGYVQSIKLEPHPQFQNLRTVLVSLSVVETLKGAQHKSLQFRQYVWDNRLTAASSPYNVGQEVLILLGPTSKYGLTSPVGLEQGMFHVYRDAKGQQIAVNGRGNVGLFNGTAARCRASGLNLPSRQAALLENTDHQQVNLDDLKGFVRTLAGSH